MSSGTYSKSSPSKLYFHAKSITVWTNAVLFSADPTLVEKYREPVQPPILAIAFTPYTQIVGLLLRPIQCGKAYIFVSFFNKLRKHIRIGSIQT